MAFSTTRVTIGHTTKKSDMDRLMDNTIALASADFDIHGEKTFYSSTVFKMTSAFETRPKLDGIKSRTSTSGVDMEVTKILQSSTATVVAMAMKVLEIGDWDMSAATGTANVSIPHGLSISDIRSVQAIIRKDDDSEYYPIVYAGGASGDIDAYCIVWNANIYINRTTGGLFDSGSWDETPYNRGWITIWYEV